MRFLIALIAFLVAAMVTTPADAREAGEMLPLLKRHEIQVLLAAKFSQADVARRAGVSVATTTVSGAGSSLAASAICRLCSRGCSRTGLMT
mgnify:CR=1 FL=1